MNIPLRIISHALLSLSILFLFCVALPASAQEGECATQDIPLEVGIGADFQVTGLADYIATAYAFMVGIVGVVATVMIMFNGLKWAGAAGNAEKVGEAKQGLISALVGLAIALISYTILNTLNPGLVDLGHECFGEPSTPTYAGSWPSCETSADCTNKEECQFGGGCTCDTVGSEKFCRPIGEGTIPEGKKCKNESNCVEGLVCYGGQNSPDVSIPGACIDLNEGEVCTSDANCGGNFTCTSTPQGKKCLSVDNRSNGMYCENKTQCASNACNTDLDPPQCVVGDGSGTDTCDDNDHCTDGFKCEDGGCVQHEEGDNCDELDEDEEDREYCWSGTTEPILFCSSAATTIYGQECVTGEYDEPCDHSAQCLRSQGLYCENEHCQDGREDDDCSDNSQCQSGVCTNGECT